MAETWIAAFAGMNGAWSGRFVLDQASNNFITNLRANTLAMRRR